MGADYELFLELLEKTGKKTSDVAKATGIRPSVFSDWKSGRYTPKMDKLQKIADYFKISVNYFTGEQEYYEERRAFWRGVIKEIRVDHEGNIFYEFL